MGVLQFCERNLRKWQRRRGDISRKKPKVTCLRCLDRLAEGDVWHWEKELGGPPRKAREGCQVYEVAGELVPLCEGG